MTKPYSPACERNRDPILAVLRQQFADCRHVLEVGSGTGQHAVYFAAALPHLRWQTSDVAAQLPGIQEWLDEAALPNTPPPIVLDVSDLDVSDPGLVDLKEPAFDAIFSANTLHIMGWPEVQVLFAALPRWLRPNGLLTVYGPFNREGRFTSESNAQFDASLRQGDAKRGIRDFEAVDALARAAGLSLIEDHTMPANNRCITWRRG